MISRPVSRLTAAIAILGTLGSTFVMFYNGIVIPEAGYALIGSIVTGASTYLFMAEKDDT